MENEFLIDSEFLSPKALEKKHRLENDPSYRKNHMEYMPGMEVIESDVCKNVMDHMNSYDYSKYTAKDVRKALEHETCSIEDFKALLSPAAEPFLEQMAQRARVETSKHFGNTVNHGIADGDERKLTAGRETADQVWHNIHGLFRSFRFDRCSDMRRRMRTAHTAARTQNISGRCRTPQPQLCVHCCV